MIRIAHLLDDFAMGGVTRSLSLFEDPRIARRAQSALTPMKRNAHHAPALEADLIVIHVPPCWSRLPYLAALRLRNPGARIVQVEHSYTRSFEKLRVGSPKRFRLLLRIASMFVDQVVAVSHGQADWLAEAGVSRTKISTIHPWSGRFELSNIPDLEARDGPLRLLAYGRFSQEKNFAALVKAMKRFGRHNVELTIFGSGPEQQELELLAQAIPNVFIHPACSDPAPWLADCDAVVLPSKHEAFGLVATEARLAGRPILVANCDGLPEQARRGGGVVATLDKPRDIAFAISHLLKRNLPAMGKAARIGVSSQHDAIIEGWLDVIEASPKQGRMSARLGLPGLASA
ncbi:glycosyltransferase [Qipengyuania aquimaris]|uniref:glycosyltransferase n=1 Tax=Qipengyuania aquimaris TaxID=255984 RepID=UPI001C96B79D|nr:glycosyltransferase [Qipengyuania aquimaris]MBY6127760.1 glycosyltransferase [Qipengyuania aquimaris]